VEVVVEKHGKTEEEVQEDYMAKLVKCSASETAEACSEMILWVDGGQLPHMISRDPLEVWSNLQTVHCACGFSLWAVLHCTENFSCWGRHWRWRCRLGLGRSEVRHLQWSWQRLRSVTRWSLLPSLLDSHLPMTMLLSISTRSTPAWEHHHLTAKWGNPPEFLLHSGCWHPETWFW
jgi:hypothetical protein